MRLLIGCLVIFVKFLNVLSNPTYEFRTSGEDFLEKSGYFKKVNKKLNKKF